MMRILHICNDFCGSKVHSNLFRDLDALVDQQVIYTYFDGGDNYEKNSFKGKHSKIIYDDILNPFIRKIYPLKKWWITKHLIHHINPTEFDCIHATTLFSDGGIALNLHKRYGIPYIVAVRMTDLGIYLSHGKYLWKYGREILKNAERIILINKAFEKKLQTLDFSRYLWDEIKEKIVIRPNGVDTFWKEHIYEGKVKNNHSVCYVGSFINRKNVLRLIAAIDTLHSDYPDLQFNIVGCRGEQEEEIRRQAEQKPYIHLLGPIHDKQLLLRVYRQNSIFAMVSTSETFGLVYLEALSQNLRLLYSQGTGIDGLFDNVGIAVDALSVESIANGLRTLIEHFDEFSGNAQIDFNKFDWETVAKEYTCLYGQITKN